MKNIATALVKAKQAFGPALKSKDNPFFKSKYADLSACLNAVDDACLAAGIVVYQETFEDATGVTVETVFLHESGEALRCGKLHVPAAKQDPQGYGSALSYARRYSLMTAAGIAAEDDDGNASSKGKTDTKDFRSSPTKGAFEGLKPARQAIINDCADSMRTYWSDDDIVGVYEVYVHIEDNEEKIALWDALKADSKMRTAIKAYGASLTSGA